MGLLIDDDDKMYVAYGQHARSAWPSSRADGFSQVERSRCSTRRRNIGPLEGSRFYKINGNYYIFLDAVRERRVRPPVDERPVRPVRAASSLFAVRLPDRGRRRRPHQGGIVQTQNGDWYYMAFNDAYPGRAASRCWRR